MNTISLLDSVSEIIDNRGKTCPTSEQGIALIATNCVKSSSLFPTRERIRFVNQYTYDNWFRGHPRTGDIIFVNKGSPGEVCLVPDNLDFCFAQDMVALRANKEKIYPLYLFAVLRSKRIKDTIRNMCVGTMIPHFKKGDFNKIYLPLPNKQIQEFIGNYYYDCSKKIHLNEKINQTLEEIANTLFKSWFVNFDPVKSKEARVSIGLSKDISDLFTDSYKDSTFGKIPQSWKVSKFGELLTPKRGKIITKKMITSGEIPVVAGGINPAYYHSKSNAKSPIVTISASGNAGYVNLFYKDIWASDCSYINKDVTDFIYFSYSFLKINQNKIFHLKHGAVQQHINPKDLMGLDIVLPPISLISKYEQIVTPLHNKISNNLNEINTLSSLRDLLLPKLISGELKVTDSQKLIDEVSV